MPLLVGQPGPMVAGGPAATSPPATDSDRREALLLAVLNSRPVVHGVPTDDLAGGDKAAAWQSTYGKTGTQAERAVIRDARDVLSDVVRGNKDATALSDWLTEAQVRPHPTSDGAVLLWEIRTDADHEIAVRAILAWSHLQTHRPGRLRPCENDACRLFLIDRSKANRARWCSMAACGNRMKARRHYERTTGRA